MASTNKPTTASLAITRPRKSISKPSLIVKLKLSPDLLRKIEPPVKEGSPSMGTSTATSNTPPVTVPSRGENAPVESKSNAPATSGTPIPSSMPPPTEGVKKKSVKRSSGVALGVDAVPKVRGKPGPKKKARLEDGSIDHSSTAPRAPPGTAAHKLGPKANQGAINAGLRALDRSGKPCRKWTKGTFNIKSFTGVVWELPRWTAPPRITAQHTSEGSASGDSSKENKDSSQLESEKSNNGAEAEVVRPVSVVGAAAPTTIPTPPVVSASTS